MITLSHINKTFPIGENQIQVLFDISLHINTGEFTAIVGPSGSGKSTLMNIIGLLDIPTTGTYTFDGIPMDSGISDRKKSIIRGEKIGFIFQNYGLIPRMTIMDQVMLPLAYQGVSSRLRRERASEALEKVGLHDHMMKKPDSLSGGQRQRVAIARALVVQPKLILADEPTGALDSHTGEEVIRLFHELHTEGSTIIIVTHSPEIASSCPRCISLRDGRIENDTKSSNETKVGK